MTEIMIWLEFITFKLLGSLFWSLKTLLMLLQHPLRLLSYTTLQLTLTLDTYSLLGLVITLSTTIYLLARYRWLNPYARLPATNANVSAAPFDLHPDATDDADGDQSYPDEFMNAFLSSIKVFGYLDKRVFHELARHLQTRKLKAGELLFRSGVDDKDFYVVVDGKVQVFVKGQVSLSTDAIVGEGHHLLNEVESGGTVSSLFSILSVFTEDLELPLKPDVQGNQDDISYSAEQHSESAKVLDDQKQTDSPVHEPGLEFDSTLESDPLKESSKDSHTTVHPDIVARAATDTTLAVIPAKTFQNLTLKFPIAAAHMVQVILTRFQRVTFMTLYRYLGLTKELLEIEKRVSKLTGHGLPRHFDIETIDHLRHQFTTQMNMNEDPDMSLDSNTLKHRFNLKRHSTKKKELKPLPTMQEYESDYSAPETSRDAYDTGRQNAFSHLLEDRDDEYEKLKESVYDAMIQLIGAVPVAELKKENSSVNVTSSTTSTPRKPSVQLTPMNAAESILFPRLARRSSSRASSVTFPQIRKGLYGDEESMADTISPTSSIGNLSSLSDRMTDIKIMFCPRGSTLIREGERVLGLYFVIDGIMEAGIPASSSTMGQSFSDDSTDSRSLFFIPPGGLAGYLAAVTGMFGGCHIDNQAMFRLSLFKQKQIAVLDLCPRKY